VSESDSVSCELLVGGSVGNLCLSSTKVPVTLIESDPSQLNQTRQLLVEMARGPVLAFLDDDAVPQPGWLRAAASLPPQSTEIWTGPETPTRSTPGALLAAQVGASILAEGYWGHIGVGDRPVRWYEVPFCNLILRRELLEQVGMPDSDMVWDLDDFDFCRRAAAQGATFRTRQDLSIRHDRYPDRISQWLTRKARERHRTGSKLVRYPAIYVQIPSVVLAAALPWAGLVVLGAAGRRRWQIASVCGAAYLIAVGGEAKSRQRSGQSGLKFAAGLIALHLTSTAALQAGLVVGVGEKLLGLPDKNSPTQRLGS
jgi:GT2 family glycosyltransferase